MVVDSPFLVFPSLKPRPSDLLREEAYGGGL